MGSQRASDTATVSLSCLQFLHVPGAVVSLQTDSGAESLILNAEDTASGIVCAELDDPDLVERDVELRFNFMSGTASECTVIFPLSGIPHLQVPISLVFTIV
jgi:hypothetical protein